MQWIFIFLVVLSSCFSLEESQKKQWKEQNERKDRVNRLSSQVHYPDLNLMQEVRDPYPWEEGYVGVHSRITKEAFRCRGCSENPPKVKPTDPGALLHDCGGYAKHSLPVKEGKEFVYPILLELLNYVQLKTGLQVVVTCGHRCPAHNTYADPSAYNANSKHMIGAEVDFYVKGMEDKPQEVIELLMRYYQEHEAYKMEKDFSHFVRLERAKLDVATPPWLNKEILIKLYLKNEGRDLDNRHPHPYISIQVRQDRASGEKVIYSWEKAFNGYMRR